MVNHLFYIKHIIDTVMNVEWKCINVHNVDDGKIELEVNYAVNVA